MSGRIQRFLEEFGKVPEGEPRQFIPDEIRIPVFIGMVLISIVLLVLLLWLVVVPAIRAQQSAAPHVQTSSRFALAAAAICRKEPGCPTTRS